MLWKIIMIIILRRIPQDSKKQEVIEFLDPILKGKIFQKPGQIEHIKILRLKNTQTKEIEVHAIVSIDSDKLAQKAILKLNRKVFNGKHIAVSEYFYRSWHKDSRSNVYQWNKELMEKRKGERRRSTLEEITKSSTTFSSQKNFHRIL